MAFAPPQMRISRHEVACGENEVVVSVTPNRRDTYPIAPLVLKKTS